ncbi:hypothetical protein ACVWW4_007994 [Bradyrhizobium sp. LB7.1]
MREQSMLEIREPCDRRKWQAPAKEARGFEHHIDLAGPERGDGRCVQTKDDRAGEVRRAGKTGRGVIEHRRAHDLNAGNAGQHRDLLGIVRRAGKQHGHHRPRRMPVEHLEQIALIVVPTRP